MPQFASKWVSIEIHCKVIITRTMINYFLAKQAIVLNTEAIISIKISQILKLFTFQFIDSLKIIVREYEQKRARTCYPTFTPGPICVAPRMSSQSWPSSHSVSSAFLVFPCPLAPPGSVPFILLKPIVLRSRPACVFRSTGLGRVLRAPSVF